MKPTVPAKHARRGFNAPLCGQTGLTVLTTDVSEDVTCRRCLHLVEQAQKEEAGQSLSVVPDTVSREDELARIQQDRIDMERRFTMREVMLLLVEGDIDYAIQRMQRGFDRQVRMAGLEGEIREHREKENA